MARPPPRLSAASRSRRSARKKPQSVLRKARNRPRSRSAAASVRFSSEPGEVVLGQVAGLLGRVSAATDQGINRIPVRGAQLGERRAGLGAAGSPAATTRLQQVVGNGAAEWVACHGSGSLIDTGGEIATGASPEWHLNRLSTKKEQPSQRLGGEARAVPFVDSGLNRSAA